MRSTETEVVNRNISLEGDLVKYSGKDEQFKLFKPLDFLALLSSHSWSAIALAAADG